MAQFTGLKVWKAAYNLSYAVYKCTEKFPRTEIYGLTAQMRRAAVSVGANIAEGQRRQTDKDFRQFLAIAEGSLAELQHYLLLARDLTYLRPDQFDDLNEQAEETARMLVGLSRKLEGGKPN